MGAGAYEELHREVERQGLRVHLEGEGRGSTSRLGRLAVVEPDPGDATGVALREVAALRIRPGRSLDQTAAALLAFLQARAAERP